MSKIVDEIGEAALLEQTAEECVELAQACLKLARKLRDENPTPMSKEDILKNINEEMADVALCLDEIVDAGFVSYEGVDFVIMQKRERWEKRVAEKKLVRGVLVE